MKINKKNQEAKMRLTEGDWDKDKFCVVHSCPKDKNMECPKCKEEDGK